MSYSQSQPTSKLLLWHRLSTSINNYHNFAFSTSYWATARPPQLSNWLIFRVPRWHCYRPTRRSSLAMHYSVCGLVCKRNATLSSLWILQTTFRGIDSGRLAGVCIFFVFPLLSCQPLLFDVCFTLCMFLSLLLFRWWATNYISLTRFFAKGSSQTSNGLN